MRAKRLRQKGLMKCRRCGFNNKPGSNFCWQCGANLADQNGDHTEIIPPGTEPDEYDARNNCPACGFPNPITANFCENCGAGLRGADPGVPAPGRGNPDWRSLLPTILMGVAIGLALLILFLGLMHFLRSNDSDDQNETTETTTQEETTTAATTAPPPTTTRPAPTTTRPASKNTPSGDELLLYEPGDPEIFDYYDVSSRNYSEHDLYGLSDNEIQKGINDIYARNGLIFETPQFQAYYDQQPWYIRWTNDRDSVKSAMNSYERKNIDLMKGYIR